MKQLALITGASSGIGYAMALQLAARNIDLVLVARNNEKLIEMQLALAGQYGISVHIFAQDIGSADAAKALYASVTQQGLRVDILINNAGVGLYGTFTETDLDTEISMINLNITALVVLTKLFARDMKSRGQGKIMNVASLLSFLPFPYYTVYSATKAFVLAFSETLAAELDGSGVVVSSICPGPVDTGFNSTAMLTTNAYSANKPVPAAFVAKLAIKHLLEGSGNKVIGFNNWFISNLPRITPDIIMMKIKKHLASQSSK